MIVVVFYRENDLLKHQLKRYVNAVQMLRAEGSQDDNSKLFYQLQWNMPKSNLIFGREKNFCV
jgi:hypothetical protein